MLLVGIGLIVLGALLLIVPFVGWVVGTIVAVAGVVLLVLHFVRVSRRAEAP